MFMDRKLFAANTPHERNSMVWFCLNMFCKSMNLPYVPMPSNDINHNKDAVEAFQQIMGLVVDGVMGKNSQEALANYIVEHVPPFNGKEPSW